MPQECSECKEMVEGYITIDQTVYFNGGTDKLRFHLCYECQRKEVARQNK